MKLKLKRNELPEYLGRIRVASSIPNIKVTYALDKTERILNNESKKLMDKRQGIKKVKDMDKYFQLQREAVDKHVKTMSKQTGEPIFKSEEDKKQYGKTVNEIDERFPDVKKTLEDHEKSFKEYAMEEIELNIHGAFLSDLPDTTSKDQFDAVKFILQDYKEE